MIGEIRILRGSPDATELATVLAVLCTMRQAAAAGPVRVLPAIWEEKYRPSGAWETGLWRTGSTRVPSARRLAA
jgi:hypothetical protein